MATEYSKKKEKIISPMDVGNKKIEYIKKKKSKITNKEIQDLGKKAREAFKLLKKHYPKIGKDY